MATVFSVKATAELPKDYIDRLVANHDVAVGFVFLEGGQLEPLLVEKGASPSIGQALEEVSAKVKGRALLGWAMDEEFVDDDEKQPFELVVDKDNNCVLYAFCEGDFRKHDDGEASPVVNFIEKYFADACTKVYNDSGQDVKKMMSIVTGKEFRAEVHADGHLKDRSVVGMIDSTGEVHFLSEGNDDAKMCSWGYTSDHLGYTEAITAPATSNEGATMKPLSEMTYAERKAAKAGKPITPAANAGAAKGSVPTVTPSGGDTKETDQIVTQKSVIITSIVKGEKIKSLHPDKNLHGRELRKWYGAHNKGGHKTMRGKPFQWKDRPAVFAEDLQRSSHFYLEFNPDQRNDAGGAKKDTATTNIPATAVTDKPLPIMSPDQVTATVLLAKDAKLQDEEGLKAATESQEPFSKRINTPIETIALWSFETFTKLPRRSVDCLLNEFRFRWLAQNPGAMKKATQPVVVEKKPSEMSYAERKAARKAAA